MAHQCSCLIKLTRFGLGIVFVLIGLCAPASALTFKSDGSVVQKSGKVENKSFADRFSSEMSRPKRLGQINGKPKKIHRIFWRRCSCSGAPLLRIQGTKKGEEYLDAVFSSTALTRRLCTVTSSRMRSVLLKKWDWRGDAVLSRYRDQ